MRAQCEFRWRGSRTPSSATRPATAARAATSPSSPRQTRRLSWGAYTYDVHTEGGSEGVKKSPIFAYFQYISFRQRWGRGVKKIKNYADVICVSPLGRRQVGPLEDVGHGLVNVGQPRVEVELRAAAAATATVAAGPPLRRRSRGDQVRDVHRVADGADVIAEKGTSIGAALLSNPFLYFRLSLLLLFRRQCVQP